MGTRVAEMEGDTTGGGGTIIRYCGRNEFPSLLEHVVIRPEGRVVLRRSDEIGGGCAEVSNVFHIGPTYTIMAHWQS